MKTIGLILATAFLVNAVGCSATPGPDKEYQKRSAEASDQQLDREVEKLKKTQ